MARRIARDGTTPKKRREPIPTLKLVMVSTFGGIALIFFTIAGFLYSAASRYEGWANTHGTVVGYGKDEAPKAKHSTCDVGIRFQYTVGGQSFEATHVKCVGNDRSDAQQHASWYKVGKTIEIRHDPRNPRDAVPEREAGLLGTIITAIAGLGFAGFAIFMAFLKGM